MKRVLALMLGLSMLFFVAACDDDDDDDVRTGSGSGNAVNVAYDVSGSQQNGVKCWGADEGYRQGDTQWCIWNCANHAYKQRSTVVLRFEWMAPEAPETDDAEAAAVATSAVEGGTGWYLTNTHYEPGQCN
ncbi:MAG: hypothetical protein ABFS19_02130 [Thermodesulfobacteriota bacterium]